MDIERLLHTYPIISDQISRLELQIILKELDKVLRLQAGGSVVEFGCYSGTTSLFLQRLIQAYTPREFHVYDSFIGLPEKTEPDVSPAGEQFKAGELATSKSLFIKHFKQAGLTIPVIHKCWFSELPPGAVPDDIIFAFLDGDFYESIRDSLRLIENKLTGNAVIIIDDYQSEALPGAMRAVDEWHKRHPKWRCRSVASLAVLTR